MLCLIVLLVLMATICMTEAAAIQDDDAEVFLQQMFAKRDVSIGSCVWGGVNYVSNCNRECKRRGYRGGHCGSFFNNICWCENWSSWVCCINIRCDDSLLLFFRFRLHMAQTVIHTKNRTLFTSYVVSFAYILDYYSTPFFSVFFTILDLNKVFSSWYTCRFVSLEQNEMNKISFSSSI